MNVLPAKEAARSKNESIQDDYLELPPGQPRHPLAKSLAALWRMPMGKFGILVLAMFILLSVGAPLFAPHDPSFQYRGEELLAPNMTFLLGTDQYGRDLLSRVIYAGRTSLLAGVLAVGIGAFVGVTTGLLSGYIGGWVDSIIMRFYDGLLTFPNILLAIALVAALGPSLLNIAIALGVSQAPLDARLTRSIVLSLRERDYVLAARSLGAPGYRIVLHHILPNTLPILLVQFSLAMGFAVLAEGSLSFLGLGTQPPTPSWGGMLNDSRPYMREAPWYGIWPGLAMAILLIALNFLTDAARDVMDPRRINIAR